jgi:hypothetical protein
MTRKEIIEELLKGTPFAGMGDLKIMGTEASLEPRSSESATEPTSPLWDFFFSLEFSDLQFDVYCEIKSQVSPKLLRQIGPWLTRLKKERASSLLYALVCPYLSYESQEYCVKAEIDFIDLCGNISLSIPGKLLLRRLGRPNTLKRSQVLRNPFSRISSRVIRVLLQFPNKEWKLTEIGEELTQETTRQEKDFSFTLSTALISQVIARLDEELLIRRDKKRILIPDPRQLLLRWAEVYKDPYKREQRLGWVCDNQFGMDIQSSITRVRERFGDLRFILTGSAAANIDAPYVSIDRIDILVKKETKTEPLRDIARGTKIGPDLFFMYPLDEGAFMYSRELNGIPLASDIQIYLDCYARGGRDTKQADYLLENVLEERWRKKQ